MPVLCFPEPDALRRALASDIVPIAITRGAAFAGRDAQGRIWLRPEVPLSRDLVTTLGRFGVRVLGTSASEMLRPIICWQQLMPFVPYIGQTPRPLLLELPIREIPRLAAELRRYAPQRMGFRWIEADSTHALVLVERLSDLLIARLRDRPTPVPIYHEQVRDIWLPLGQAHPFAKQIPAPDGGVFLLDRPELWRTVTQGPFVPELAEPMPVPTVPSRWMHRPAPRRLTETLRLKSTGQSEVAEMWVIDDQPRERLEDLLDTLEESTLARLSFALANRRDGGSRLLLRVRSGRGSIPVLVGLGRTYRGFLKLPNLYLPTGTRLTPPPRRDVLRSLLRIDGKQVTWLVAHPSGTFQIESLPETAFRPLLDRVRYTREAMIVHRPPTLTLNWFQDEPFVQAIEVPKGQAWQPIRKESVATPEAIRTDAALAESPPEPDRGNWLRRLGSLFGIKSSSIVRDASANPEEPAIEIGEALTTFLTKSTTVKTTQATPEPDRVSDISARRHTLEMRFLESLGVLKPEERLELWPELAAIYNRTHHPGDAAICWLNALWEQDRLSHLWAWGWLQAESRQIRGSADRDARTAGRDSPTTPSIQRWLEAAPNPARARSIAAFVVWVALVDHPPPELPGLLAGIQRYLDRHENWLPVRAVWLTRLALAHLTQGDLLSLARTRDRLMTRLMQHGLSLDLDVPSFLRFASQGVSDRYSTVRDWLMRIRDPIRRWISESTQIHTTNRATDVPASAGRLQPFGLDPEVPATRAFADLILAWGLARLGEHSACNGLRQQAQQILAKDDVVHATLFEIFDYRIRQVQEGKPSKGSLPAEILEHVHALVDDDRYKVDKLREHSRILEPIERVDAFRGAVYRHYSQDDALLQQLRNLPEMLNSREVNETAQRLLEFALRLDSATLLPLTLNHLLDVLPRLSEGLALRVLRHMGEGLDRLQSAPTDQVRLLEKGIVAAVHLGHISTFQELVARMVRLLESGRGYQGVREMENLISQALRGMRRLGLKAECERLLGQMEQWVLRGGELRTLRQRDPAGWPMALRTLLHLAGGWFYIGKDTEATTILDEARDQLLYTGQLPTSDQTALAITYAATLGQASMRIALGRLGELFQRLRGLQINGFTNTHYTLKSLELIETVIRAIVNEDFTLGPTVRRWLDDDEYLIRRRIDRDVHDAMRRHELN